jgi:hypothetical protein
MVKQWSIIEAGMEIFYPFEAGKRWDGLLNNSAVVTSHL